AARLENHCRRAERGEMNLQGLFERSLHAEQARSQITRVYTVSAPRDLPEARRVDPRLTPQRLRADAPRLVDQDLQPNLGEAFVQAIAHALQVQRARDEQVPDPEARIGSQRRA